MLLITYWSDQPTLPIDQPEVRWLLFNMQHRLAHLIGFGLLGLLGAWAFEGWRRATLLAIAVTCVFSALDEIHQSFVPGRRAGVDDWLFDTFSAWLALFLWPRLLKRRPELKAHSPLLAGLVFAVGLLTLLAPLRAVAMG